MKFSPLTLKLVVFAIFLLYAERLNAQDFYNDYQAYLDNHQIFGAKPAKRDVKELKFFIKKAERTSGKSFFLSDTIYIINFRQIENGLQSTVVWNRFNKCYYVGSLIENINSKKKGKRVAVSGDAVSILQSFAKDFRLSIETIDTARYKKFALANQVLDGEIVSPLIAIRTKHRWHFVDMAFGVFQINYIPLNK